MDVRVCVGLFLQVVFASTHWTWAVAMLYGWRVGGRGDGGEGGHHLLLDCDGLHGHLLRLGHKHKANFAARTPDVRSQRGPAFVNSNL